MSAMQSTSKSTIAGWHLETIIHQIGDPVSMREFRRDGNAATNYEWSCGCFGTLQIVLGEVTWCQCTTHRESR